MGHPEHTVGGGPEQDFLSRALADRPWTNMSVIFNYQLHQIFHQMNPRTSAERKFYLLPENQTKVRVIHYSGTLKPWHHVLHSDYQERSVNEFVQLCLNGFDTYTKWYRREGFDNDFADSSGVYYCEDKDELFCCKTSEDLAWEEKQAREKVAAEAKERSMTTAESDSSCAGQYSSRSTVVEQTKSKAETAIGKVVVQWDKKIDMKGLEWFCERAIDCVKKAHVQWLSVWQEMYLQDLDDFERKVFRVIVKQGEKADREKILALSLTSDFANSSAKHTDEISYEGVEEGSTDEGWATKDSVATETGSTCKKTDAQGGDNFKKADAADASSIPCASSLGRRSGASRKKDQEASPDMQTDVMEWGCQVTLPLRWITRGKEKQIEEEILATCALAQKNENTSTVHSDVQ